KLVQQPQLLVGKGNDVRRELECNDQVGIAAVDVKQAEGQQVLEQGLLRIPLERNADVGDFVPPLLQFLEQAVGQVFRAAADEGHLHVDDGDFHARRASRTRSQPIWCSRIVS